MPERTSHIQTSSEYQNKYDRSVFAFKKIVGQAMMGEIPTASVNGYSIVENRLLVAQLAAVLSRHLLGLSHCTHRAVAATLGLHFQQYMEPSKLDEINNYLRRQNKIGQIFYTSRETTSMIIFGVNNWFDTQTDEKHLFDCKIMPGVPVEIDNPCPKRSPEKPECRITHAERSVIVTAKEILQEIGLGHSDRTILTTTWVSCPNCVNLMAEDSETFGKKINVFSVYGAQGDEDDEKMARVVREFLQEKHLGRLAGPLITIPHNLPGYGWLPARKNFVENLTRNDNGSNNALSLMRSNVDGQMLLYALRLVSEVEP